MVQLLSMDYQRQWLEESRHKDEEQRRKTKVRRLEPILPSYVYQSTGLQPPAGKAASGKEEA